MSDDGQTTFGLNYTSGRRRYHVVFREDKAQIYSDSKVIASVMADESGMVRINDVTAAIRKHSGDELVEAVL